MGPGFKAQLRGSPLNVHQREYIPHTKGCIGLYAHRPTAGFLEL